MWYVPVYGEKILFIKKISECIHVDSAGVCCRWIFKVLMRRVLRTSREGGGKWRRMCLTPNTPSRLMLASQRQPGSQPWPLPASNPGLPCTYPWPYSATCCVGGLPLHLCALYYTAQSTHKHTHAVSKITSGMMHIWKSRTKHKSPRGGIRKYVSQAQVMVTM